MDVHFRRPWTRSFVSVNLLSTRNPFVQLTDFLLNGLQVKHSNIPTNLLKEKEKWDMKGTGTDTSTGSDKTMSPSQYKSSSASLI